MQRKLQTCLWILFLKNTSSPLVKKTQEKATAKWKNTNSSTLIKLMIENAISHVAQAMLGTL